MPENNLFWLVSSVKRITPIFAERKDDTNDVEFLPWIIDEAKVSDHGYYQCAFLKPGKQNKWILSKKAEVQFDGMYLYRIAYSRF